MGPEKDKTKWWGAIKNFTGARPFSLQKGRISAEKEDMSRPGPSESTYLLLKKGNPNLNKYIEEFIK
jgi:hypothetical protein